MTDASQSTPTGGKNDSIDAESDETIHGGVPAVQAGMEVFATPEESAEIVVDELDGQVSLSIRSTKVSGKLFLSSEQADDLADRLAEAGD